MKRLLKVIASTLLLTTSLAASATDWYQVELIIFANQDRTAISEEHWPTIQEIPENPKAAQIQRATTEQLPFQALSDLSLKNEASRLKRSSNYRVLYHGGWIQPVYHTQTPRPVHIRAGEVLDNGMHELDGYIGVGRGRYLHFRPNIFFSQYLNPNELNTLQSDTTNNQPIESASAATNTINHFPAIPEILTINLDQARRMRSDEVHYIDHPLLGIIVKITPSE
ncbi:CsiV family protein [uncultured Neptuniibacter sp.]|uniref:CsiV family protein n=1 Tax=uncultured Neptuniibacter sp. TaxID=502143 RepID=UPI0026250D1B|nr:CsiV family protein [uncultured Neptuniibacter sp.]